MSKIHAVFIEHNISKTKVGRDGQVLDYPGYRVINELVMLTSDELKAAKYCANNQGNYHYETWEI